MNQLVVKLWMFCLLAALCVPSPACANKGKGEFVRNPQWAQPIQMEGVGNFYKVDDLLYRSEQPTAEGFQNLAKFGIVSVVNLRAGNDDPELAANTGLNTISVPITTWNITEKDVVLALEGVRRAEGPVLLHCRHGADRTGLIVALYRVLYQGWSKEKAKDEMLNGGYGFHSIWFNIPDYLDEVDIEKIRGMVE